MRVTQPAIPIQSAKMRILFFYACRFVLHVNVGEKINHIDGKDAPNNDAKKVRVCLQDFLERAGQRLPVKEVVPQACVSQRK